MIRAVVKRRRSTARGGVPGPVAPTAEDRARIVDAAVDQIAAVLAEAVRRGPQFPLQSRIRDILRDAGTAPTGFPRGDALAIVAELEDAIGEILLDHPSYRAALGPHAHRFMKLSRPSRQRRVSSPRR